MSSVIENIAPTVPVRRTIINEQRVRTVLLRISQFATWPIAFVYFHLLYRLRIHGHDNLKKVSDPFIIVANHVSFSDSFLLRLILGFFSPHLPLRFMAVRRFNWPWLNFMADVGIIDFIYALFGVFTIVRGLGIHKNLEEAKRIIKAGGNIVMYPEGKIITMNMVAPFKPGAAILAVETGTQVLPIAFRLSPRKFLRPGLIVNVGEPIKIKMNMKIDDATKMLYDTIVELYGRE